MREEPNDVADQDAHGNLMYSLEDELRSESVRTLHVYVIKLYRHELRRAMETPNNLDMFLLGLDEALSPTGIQIRCKLRGLSGRNRSEGGAAPQCVKTPPSAAQDPVGAGFRPLRIDSRSSFEWILPPVQHTRRCSRAYRKAPKHWAVSNQLLDTLRAVVSAPPHVLIMDFAAFAHIPRSHLRVKNEWWSARRGILPFRLRGQAKRANPVRSIGG